jgi:hypothetical protein
VRLSADTSVVFEEHDKLLSVQTLIPVLYWFVRQEGDRNASKIRPFLQQFEKERAEVRAQLNARGRGEQVQVSNDNLTAFNRWLRTPDDKSNLQAMFTELERRFSDFLRTYPSLL